MTEYPTSGDDECVRGVLLDLDGVVYVGDAPVPGAAAAVDWLAREGDSRTAS